jgi:hypothetical protein
MANHLRETKATDPLLNNTATETDRILGVDKRNN